MLRKRRGAVTPARDRAPVLRRAAESTRARRVVVPQLEDLAAALSDIQLARIRLQAQPGDRVAVYAHARELRGQFVLIGNDRPHRRPPTLEDWGLVGVVEITEDGERALPIAV